MQNLEFSIILPVYQQETQIVNIIDGYYKELACQDFLYEIILVVNGSSDKSLEVCQKLSQQYSSVKVIDTPKKGWGTAVRLGLKEARGEFICYTNSSRTQAKDLLKMLKYSKQNPDHVIKTNRKIRENWKRRLGSLLYNLECRMFFDLSYWDINATPKIFPRRYEELLKLTREDDLIDLEFLVICKQNNFPVLEIPTFSYKRLGGKSTTGYRTALKLYTGAFQFWLKHRQK